MVPDNEPDSGWDYSGIGLVAEDVRRVRAISVETEVSDTNETVDQCYVEKEVEIEAGTNMSKGTIIETIEPQNSAVEALGEAEGTLIAGLRESEYITVDVPREPDNTTVNTESVRPSIDPIGERFGDGEPDGNRVGFGESDDLTIDMIGDLIPHEDSATVQLLGHLDSTTDIPGGAITMDVHCTIEVGPIVPEYDTMDLDMPGPKSKDESIEAADALYTLSQDQGPRISGGLSSWQVVNRTRWDVPEAWDPKLSTGTGTKDPKELLRNGWNWVFQR